MIKQTKESLILAKIKGREIGEVYTHQEYMHLSSAGLSMVEDVIVLHQGNVVWLTIDMANDDILISHNDALFTITHDEFKAYFEDTLVQVDKLTIEYCVKRIQADIDAGILREVKRLGGDS